MKTRRSVSMLILICFLSACFIHPAPMFAASTTGGLKIFSEITGIKVYVDQELKGTDVIEIKDLEPGDHYVKVTKDDQVLYSELVKVTAGTMSAILIKSQGPTKEQVQQAQDQVQQTVDNLYKQGQQYKQEKIDILLSKSYQTVGSSYTSDTYFPGYYSIYGSGWTTSSSTAYETTDWKIIKGGVQEISDRDFATLIGDKNTLAAMDKDWEDYNNTENIGAIVAVTGVVMVLVGGISLFSSDASGGGAIIFAIGCLPTLVGLGMLSKNPPSGHYVNPGTAAKQAFDYNQSLKKKLGLPESYEPK